MSPALKPERDERLVPPPERVTGGERPAEPLSRSTEPRVSQYGEPTVEILDLFPRQGEWTEVDFLRLPDRARYEFVDGRVEQLSMPEYSHQFIVRFLFRVLDAFTSRTRVGEALFAPLRVRLPVGNYREPDIVFVKAGFKPTPQGYADNADLVMEVVSPSKEDRQRDLVEKRADYARAGIPEYWIVDPESRTITVLVHTAGDYREAAIHREGEFAKSFLLSGFSVDVSACFAAGDEGAAFERGER